MTEYQKIIARSGIRFSGSSVVLSPQLDDFGVQHVLYHLSSERDVAFRAILYVPNLESHEVKITFPSENILEVRFRHDFRTMEKRYQRQEISWSRDCKYLYRLPNGVGRDRMTASWTNDEFLVIQARGLASLTPLVESQLLVPTRVCAILKPFMDLGILVDSLKIHNLEINAIIDYLERKGMVSQDNDVLRLLLDYPGKPRRMSTPNPSPRKKSTPNPSPRKKSTPNASPRKKVL